VSQIIAQRIATLLGNYGLLVLTALAAAQWLPLDRRLEDVLTLSLVAYVAVVLAFLGAVHWGLAMHAPALDRRQARTVFGWGVVPALLGWLAVLMAAAGLAPAVVLVFLLGDLLLVRMMDGVVLAMVPGVPAWYLPLRSRLTIGGALALLVAIVSTL
jgi:hypothetical protein